MPDRNPLAPPVDDSAAPTSTKPTRRKRMRMGEAAGLAGGAGRPVPAKSAIELDLLQRERAQKAKALLEGGRNKGEQKGYGAAGPGKVNP